MKIKDRELLQKIGESMRAIDPDVWVKYTFRRIKTSDKIVIADCRRSNEYNYAVSNGFFSIRITAPLEARIKRCTLRDGVIPDISLWENESENGADDKEYFEINNDGTLDELYKIADDIIYSRKYI